MTKKKLMLLGVAHYRMPTIEAVLNCHRIRIRLV